MLSWLPFRHLHPPTTHILMLTVLTPIFSQPLAPHAFVLPEPHTFLYGSLAPVFPVFPDSPKASSSPIITPSLKSSCSHTPFSNQVPIVTFAASFTTTQQGWESTSPFNSTAAFQHFPRATRCFPVTRSLQDRRLLSKIRQLAAKVPT